MTHANKNRRSRAIRKSQAARMATGVSGGIAGAMLLAGGAPVAASAARTNQAIPVQAAAVPSGEASVRLEAATGAGQQCFPMFGTCKQITETLNPTSINADGTSTSTATATVESCTAPAPCTPVTTGHTVVFTSSDPGETVGPTTNNNDGTYTAVVTASTTVGQATITATDTFTVFNQPGSISASAILTQVRVPGARLAVVVKPNSIVANGTSTSIATATVTDTQGRVVSGELVVFTSSDAAEKITSTTDHGNGTYTVTITSSRKVEVATVTATDTSEAPHLTGQAPLRQTPVPTPSVPAAGATDGVQAPAGAALLAVGVGLLGSVARWRRRALRASG